MRKRIRTLTIAVAALAALALGGSALATASSSPSSGARETVSATDPGPAVQQGDQTTPDGAKKASAASVPGSDPAGANDTSSPDTGEAAERASENAPENASETGPSDGPGGHEDLPGQDSQFQGEQP